MSYFKKLGIVSVADIDTIERPCSASNLDLNSPARELLTDFHQQTPMMLEQSTSVEEALALMQKAHVKMALVITVDEHFCGIVTASDLVSVKVMRVSEASGLRRADLTVGHIMKPRKELHAIEQHALRAARIGDVLDTMKHFGDQHVLVVDSTAGSISGLISASDIARKLHVPVYISEKANSFSDIVRAVRT